MVPLESPGSRHPDDQHVFWQHSDWSHASSQSCWSSSPPRATVIGGHWLVPLESPLSRQPAAQHETGGGEDGFSPRRQAQITRDQIARRRQTAIPERWRCSLPRQRGENDEAHSVTSRRVSTGSETLGSQAIMPVVVGKRSDEFTLEITLEFTLQFTLQITLQFTLQFT